MQLCNEVYSSPREGGALQEPLALFMVLQEEGCLEGEDKSRCTVYTLLLLSSIHSLHERSDPVVLQESGKMVLALKGSFLLPLTLNAKQQQGFNNCGRRGT